MENCPPRKEKRERERERERGGEGGRREEGGRDQQ